MKYKNKTEIFDDLDIIIEVPAKGKRTGTNKDGEKWEKEIPSAYGYIKNTHSPDGEDLDCYIYSKAKENKKVYVIHQMTPDGKKYDEDKVFLGYPDKETAIEEFNEVTFKPKDMFGGITEFDMEHFKVIAYASSNSKTMITDQKTYDTFKEKGYLKNIHSPISMAKKVSESLEYKLTSLAENINKGPIIESLENTSNIHEAYNYYKNINGTKTKHQFMLETIRELYDTNY